MTRCRLIARNTRTNTILGDRIAIAGTVWTRMRGLIGGQLASGQGLLIVPCQGIHTYFMRAPIDVVFLGKEDGVLRTDAAVRPWRFIPYVRRGRQVLELPPGTLARTGTRPGDVIAFERVEE